ncbi:FtsW/RodA/SpoVE family cell cycle protein [Alicyclobacillus tolerans]|uniref:FtsW/RodA/SpoVE family cell cycle protein n=1 Tax=Alicyclobacillus tolerans TaxID=90970 RepID=UPI003B78C832
MQKQSHQPDFLLYFAVLALTAIGIVTVYSASTVIALEQGMSAAHFALRQLIFGGIGVVLMTVVTFIPYQIFYRYAAKLMIVSLFLLFLVLIPGIGHRADGSRRWLGPASLHIQPSELALIALILYLAFFFTKKVTIIHSTMRVLRPALLVTVATASLIFLEPDMGTAFTVAATGFIMLFISGIRLKPVIITFIASIPVLYGLIEMAKYRSSRLEVYFHPFQHPAHAYQLISGLTGIARGGLIGTGFDASIEKAGYLPIPQADFIFAVFVEEWGLLGAIALLAIFALLVWRGFRIARFAKDRFGSLLAVGITGMMIVQAFVNLAAVTWLLPITGIPLPFISYGGTSLMMMLLASGILLSISRQTLDVAPEADELADVYDVSEVLRERKRLPIDPMYQQQKKKKPATVAPLKRNKSTAKSAIHYEKTRKNRDGRASTMQVTTWRERSMRYDNRLPNNRKQGSNKNDRT